MRSTSILTVATLLVYAGVIALLELVYQRSIGDPTARGLLMAGPFVLACVAHLALSVDDQVAIERRAGIRAFAYSMWALGAGVVLGVFVGALIHGRPGSLVALIYFCAAAISLIALVTFSLLAARETFIPSRRWLARLWVVAPIAPVAEWLVKSIGGLPVSGHTTGLVLFATQVLAVLWCFRKGYGRV